MPPRIYCMAIGIEHYYPKGMLALVMALLSYEGIGYILMDDPQTCGKLTKGNVHPIHGFVVESEDGTLMLNVYDVCDWITRKGLRRI